MSDPRSPSDITWTTFASQRAAPGPATRLDVNDKPVTQLNFSDVEYLEANPDVAAAVRQGTFSSGKQHYLLHGRNEGRPLAPRISRVLFKLDRRGRGLEIGPSINPVAPKREGYRVEIVDYLDRDGLVDKFVREGGGHMYGLVPDLAARIQQIEEVDYVWTGQPLSQLIGQERCYDWIVASHVIEHLPNPMQFLRECFLLLAPQGALSLVIPDRRYCFDCVTPLTTTGDWLDAWYERRSKPTPGQVFDSVANAVSLDGKLAWSRDAQGELIPMHSITSVREHFERASDSTEYVDVHCWRFIPESFRLIVKDLLDLGLIELEVRREIDTEGNEFFVQLHARSNERAVEGKVRIDSQRSIEQTLAAAALALP